MRGMKNVIVFVLFGLLGVSRSFAQEASINTDNELTTIAKGVQRTSVWQEDEQNYTRSLSFRRQVGITQIAAGSVFLPSGLAMIAVGTHKMNLANNSRGTTPEGVPTEEDVMGRKAGIIMITTGTVCSVAGALLMMTGRETLLMFQACCLRN